MTDEEMAEEWLDERYLKDMGVRKPCKQAYFAGLKAGRPKWHKVADGDLPKNSDDKKLYLVYWGENDYGVAQFNNSRWWSLDSGWYDAEDVIAWCEIPKYTEE